MALRNLRKTTEVVPSASSSLLNGNETFGQVERFVEKEDNSNFTVNKWRNKVFTDTRVRSKQKDQNYRVRIREDVELTRNAVQKTLQEKYDLKLCEDPISVGKDATIFAATFTGEVTGLRGTVYYGTERNVVVKVWNRTAKELLESKKEIYDADPSLAEEVTNSSPSEFPALWAAREMKHYEKLRAAGILCPTPLFCIKNIFVMERELDPLALIPPTSHDTSSSFASIVKTMKGLFTLGMVSIHLDETNVGHTGLIFDAGQVLPTSHPKAMETLFRNCQNVQSFCGGNNSRVKSKRPIPSQEETFFMVTGFEYSPPKSSLPVRRNGESSEQEIKRKTERKSERSHHAATKLKNQEILVK